HSLCNALEAWMAMGPRWGVGQERVSTIFSPWTTRLAQGWASERASAGTPGNGSARLRPEAVRPRSVPGAIGDDALRFGLAKQETRNAQTRKHATRGQQTGADFVS